MLQLTPQSRIFVALQPVDFRKGIAGLTAVCRQGLGENPLDGAVYVFRNRAGTTLKLLLYDGQGFWLCTKRLSQGRFQGWPTAPAPSVRLSARELSILLWKAFPTARRWRPSGARSSKGARAQPSWRALCARRCDNHPSFVRMAHATSYCPFRRGDSLRPDICSCNS